jgi:hypothetical protein
MRTSLKLVGSVAGAALLMTSAGPAAAQGWRGGGWGGGWGPPRYRHYDRGSDAGAIIGAVAVVGIIAAIASASANKRNTTDRRYDGPSPSSSTSGSGTVYTDRPYDERGYDDPRYGNGNVDRGYDDSPAIHASQDEAVDACVIAARNEGTSRAGYADVREIANVRPRGNGWDVTGTISERQNYRAVGNLRSFTCAFQDGRVSNVALD